MLEKVGGLTESHMASVNYSKVTKTFGQVTPRDTDKVKVEHRLDEEAIFLGSNPAVPTLLGNKCSIRCH